ncbi:flavin-containing monooxygenase [Pseudobacter ginsenosidimutans]|uniref:Cation diffusion facilitator CzcD-associated flavoprotein CzcO n=1 Tax=Pseudobacter ginsenosidimutans TaxID=661488 RepID=A0A4Q7N170_9BACT|nr:NAD(P)/FAD-dependent oxidoreductase [Pseudobacter ginsenosidimutans]RZS75357.1 cation diffusion facilitator CzcD-associated flavoprotein CzcO [Pseudobacter ginsenosidimutans]
MKHIGIIGAGISGLATAKAFIEKGYQVTVLEKAASAGGVWEKSRSYVGVATQTTRDEYAFSDYPMPAGYPLWPSGEQVQAYLEGYAKRFRVFPHIWFNVRVNALSFRDGAWHMQLTDLKTAEDKYMRFDFVAICTGTFHKPYIPAVAGSESFLQAGGEILHSSQVKDANILKGKKVAVVGFAKSATDIATTAAGNAAVCTLLYRKAQWKVPRYFGNKVNMRFLLFSRLSEAFFSAPRKSIGQKLLHSIGRPLVWAQWRGLEALLKMQFKLKACGMVPKHRIEDQISCSLGVAPEGFYEKVRSGLINAKQTTIAKMEGKNVMLSNGETIQPDLVVFGTGFTQELPFLEPAYKQFIIGQNGQYRLFRNIINPQVPQLGFVGFNSSLFTTLTSEVAANWLVRYAEQKLALPSQEAMNKDMDHMEKWRSDSRPIASEFSGTCIAPFNYQHLDLLMRDMGLKRKLSLSPFEYLKPINPKDYHQLLRGKGNTIVKEMKTEPEYQFY